MNDTDTDICPLCNRPLAEPCNKHHLIPISKGGKHTDTILLHKVCHDKIHAVLTEKELKSYYHTIERLKAHEDIARFIKWLQNKPAGFYDRSVRMKSNCCKYLSFIQTFKVHPHLILN